MSFLVCGTGAIAQALTKRLPGKIVVAGRQGAADIRVDFSKAEEVGAALGGTALPADLRGVAYCVGTAVMKPLRAVGAGDCLEAFSVNALGAMEVVKAALPQLKKNRGSVVLFSSVAVQTGFPNHVVIGMAKGAVEGLAMSLAAELAPNVRVNCIAPSLTTGAAITAPLTANEATAAKIAAAHPLARLGTPDDSAALAALLLSDDGSWITGQVFGVDGGRGSIVR